jgi:hypothetical protein
MNPLTHDPKSRGMGVSPPLSETLVLLAALPVTGIVKHAIRMMKARALHRKEILTGKKCELSALQNFLFIIYTS